MGSLDIGPLLQDRFHASRALQAPTCQRLPTCWIRDVQPGVHVLVRSKANSQPTATFWVLVTQVDGDRVQGRAQEGPGWARSQRSQRGPRESHAVGDVRLPPADGTMVAFCRRHILEAEDFELIDYLSESTNGLLPTARTFNRWRRGTRDWEALGPASGASLVQRVHNLSELHGRRTVANELQCPPAAGQEKCAKKASHTKDGDAPSHHLHDHDTPAGVKDRASGQKHPPAVPPTARAGDRHPGSLPPLPRQ